MTTAALKKKIYDYIDTSDENILKAVYLILEEHAKSKELDIYFSEMQKKELEKRRKAHISGKSKSVTFEQIKKQAISRLK